MCRTSVCGMVSIQILPVVDRVPAFEQNRPRHGRGDRGDRIVTPCGASVEPGLPVPRMGLRNSPRLRGFGI